MRIQQRFIGMISILLMTILLAACSGQSTSSDLQQEEKPRDVKQTFLYYTEEYVDPDGYSIGDLYLKNVGNDEMDKISTGVKNGQFFYDNESEKVLFVNHENVLYEYGVSKNKVKLAEGVSTFQLGNDQAPVTYHNESGDLYIVKEDKEVEKIASAVYQHELIDEDLYYVTSDGHLRVYNIESRVEEDIANQAFYFVIFNKAGDLAYINDDSFLYYRNGEDGDNIKISSHEVSSENIQLIDGKLVYIGNDGNDTMALFTANVTGEGTVQKIASEVNEYTFSNGHFYYKNYDESLYQTIMDDDKAIKLASEVMQFMIHDGDIIFYIDTENDMYKLEGEHKEKVASGAIRYNLTSNGDVIYSTENNELFINDQKLTADLERHHYFYGSLAYSTKEEDKLYLMADMGEAQVVEEDLTAYSNAYYHNELVYMNLLGFEEIAGVWRTDDNVFIEFNKDGTMNNLTYNVVETMTLDYADYNTLHAHIGDEYFDISIVDQETILFNMQGDQLYLTKSSKSESDQYIAEELAAAYMEEVEYVLYLYVTNFANAVNYGESEYITQYISPSSDLYREQEQFVSDMYDQNIMEELVSYDILEIKPLDKEVYEVTVNEEFIIHDMENADEKLMTYQNVYTVERIGEEFLITNLKASVDDQGSGSDSNQTNRL